MMSRLQKFNFNILINGVLILKNASHHAENISVQNIYTYTYIQTHTYIMCIIYCNILINILILHIYVYMCMYISIQ